MKAAAAHLSAVALTLPLAADAVSLSAGEPGQAVIRVRSKFPRYPTLFIHLLTTSLES